MAIRDVSPVKPIPGLLVDPEDEHWLKEHRYYLNNRGYAFRNEWVAAVKSYRMRSLHRDIMQPEDDLTVDHINGNRLDNRRSNLRLMTLAEQQQNQKFEGRNSKSGVRGVFKNKKKWQVMFKKHGRQINFGSYESKLVAIEMARAAIAMLFPLNVEG